MTIYFDHILTFIHLTNYLLFLFIHLSNLNLFNLIPLLLGFYMFSFILKNKFKINISFTLRAMQIYASLITFTNINNILHRKHLCSYSKLLLWHIFKQGVINQN